MEAKRNARIVKGQEAIADLRLRLPSQAIRLVSPKKNSCNFKLQLADESLLYLGEDLFGLLRFGDRDAKLRDILPSWLNQL